MHNSWGHAWHLITVLLAEQNLPATLGSSFHVVQMEIRSHIPEENQSAEMEAEIQHCAIPQRLPLGNNKPFIGPCKEENVNSTFADAANISQEANLTKYQNIRPLHQDLNSSSMPTSVSVEKWLNFSSVSSLPNLCIKPLRQLCFQDII